MLTVLSLLALAWLGSALSVSPVPLLSGCSLSWASSGWLGSRAGLELGSARLASITYWATCMQCRDSGGMMDWRSNQLDMIFSTRSGCSMILNTICHGNFCELRCTINLDTIYTCEVCITPIPYCLNNHLIKIMVMVSTGSKILIKCRIGRLINARE